MPPSETKSAAPSFEKTKALLPPWDSPKKPHRPSPLSQPTEGPNSFSLLSSLAKTQREPRLLLNFSSSTSPDFSFSPQPRPSDPAHSIFFISGHYPAIGIFGSQNQKPQRGLLFPVEAATPRLNTVAAPAVFFNDGVFASTPLATHRPVDPAHQTAATSNLFVSSN
ncbi:PREDICTED: uncharacterized protein LOC105118069 [Populus euphratica]|uniref:Uncharacterized protein LOC105118069 n=1 Tax=Populus euphratica TaxID=75702 RepID=A0AAJ6TNM4_POPEU|nr:PREDICTED: uncharacterized protein LOC105118069 [Populus euphratica]